MPYEKEKSAQTRVVHSKTREVRDLKHVNCSLQPLVAVADESKYFSSRVVQMHHDKTFLFLLTKPESVITFRRFLKECSPVA